MEALPLRAGRANCMSNIQQDMIEQEGKVNVRGNIVLTKGYSTMRMKPREEGGVPPLTYTGMSEEVADMVTPLLTFLTKKVLEKGYNLRGGDMFSQYELHVAIANKKTTPYDTTPLGVLHYDTTPSI
jgi:hypothetical protein